MSVYIEYSFENEDGDEVILDIEATVTPYVPAVLNPVDVAHPEEGGEIEDITLKLKGKEISMRDAISMGLNENHLIDELNDAAAEQEFEYDDDFYDDLDR